MVLIMNNIHDFTVDQKLYHGKYCLHNWSVLSVLYDKYQKFRDRFCKNSKNETTFTAIFQPGQDNHFSFLCKCWMWLCPPKSACMYIFQLLLYNSPRWLNPSQIYFLPGWNKIFCSMLSDLLNFTLLLACLFECMHIMNGLSNVSHIQFFW